MISGQDLKWFMELSGTQHMTRASERLGVSQPTLSHWLKNLEHELGQTLFHRSRQGMELTAFGEKLRRESGKLLQSWEDFLQSLQRDEKELRGRFRFGVHASVGLFALPAIFQRLGVDAPGIRLDLSHGLSRHLTEDVISKRLDAALVVNPVAHPDLIIRELYKDQVRAFSIKGKVRERLIAHPHVFQVQQLRERLKALPDEVLETDSFEVAAHLAMAGEGIALLPERVALALSEGKLRPQGELSITDRHCLIYRANLRETAAGQALVKVIKEADYK